MITLGSDMLEQPVNKFTILYPLDKPTWYRWKSSIKCEDDGVLIQCRVAQKLSTVGTGLPDNVSCITDKSIWLISMILYRV